MSSSYVQSEKPVIPDVEAHVGRIDVLTDMLDIMNEEWDGSNPEAK